ncbi:DUF305 domain-containing protein [Streptomyces sp. NPDC088097]|uniref:DUF305 domain-containing protein n=1 Tax=Streptomyces sp. NPDC088097 TaxID=3365823 RepID=UPI003817F88F
MTKTTRTTRTTRLAVATAAGLLLLAACGSGTSDNPSDGSAHGSHQAAGATPTAKSTTTPTGGANAADTAFAQGMVPHHRQAIEMASLAPTRAESAEVKALAEEIKKAQDPEIATLSGWLTSWGQQVPAADSGHEGHDMSSMMSSAEMDLLAKASGKAFDTEFLRLMVKHHEGAVAMARTERTEGAHQPAKDMADAIIRSQGAEISRMNALLAKN